nr:aldo/keto reductase [Kineococcus siccus]
MGCWAIGGAMAAGDQPLGYSGTDDAESTAALHRAVELGVTLLDTADAYGAGHSERLLAPVLAAHPHVRVATKFGNTIDEQARQLTGTDVSPDYVRRAADASLGRLGRERLDLYQVHSPDMSGEQAADLVEALEGLVEAGKVAWYGVSTDDPELLRPFVSGPHCTAAQVQLNVFDANPAMLEACRADDLGVLVRSPLAMGLLGGRYDATTQLPAHDVRGRQPEWLRWFADGRPAPDFLERLDAVRGVLTSGGRTLAQGALAWIWAHDAGAVALPGFRSRAQVEENVGALVTGPLSEAEHRAVEIALGRDGG